MGFFAGKKTPVPHRSSRRPMKPKSPDILPASPEEKMRGFLALPDNMGRPPDRCRECYSGEYQIPSAGRHTLTVFEFGYNEDGPVSEKGVVGPLAWAPLNPDVAGMGDRDHCLAYCGLLAMNVGLHGGIIKQHEVDEEIRLSDFKHVKAIYKFEFPGANLIQYEGVLHDGRSARGASDGRIVLTFPEDLPMYHIPAVYILLGMTANPLKS